MDTFHDHDTRCVRLIPINFAQSGTKLAPVSEAEVRAAFTARLGMPLTGQMLHGNLPFYPSLIEGEPTYIYKQMQKLEQAPPVGAGGGRQHPVYHTAAPITDTQVAHARLHKAGHRPLGSMFPLCLRSGPSPFPVCARALFRMIDSGLSPPRKVTRCLVECAGAAAAAAATALSQGIPLSRAKHSTRPPPFPQNRRRRRDGLLTRSSLSSGSQVERNPRPCR